MGKALFSIGQRKKVVFAKGNLQYQASTGQWRFAEHQFDFVGKENANVSPDYDGWIDLFDWETGNNPNNPIVGGEECRHWRLLDQNEWGYLCYERETESGIRFAKAKVHGVNGLVIVPDDWDGSDYGFSNADEEQSFFGDNIISDEQWEVLEEIGVVFLPAAGYHCDGVHDVRKHGTYWTSSPMGMEGAMHFVFSEKDFFTDELDRFYGCSVRLVRRAR